MKCEASPMLLFMLLLLELELKSERWNVSFEYKSKQVHILFMSLFCDLFMFSIENLNGAGSLWLGFTVATARRPTCG